ncbi:hypothetical protein ODY73_03575 [Aerococcus sp. JJEM-2022b]|uniref:hypothetical protein n=1 Tax=Aerococcus mictus TaxID=2976810 RepID=UPI0018A7943D|nr:hypothetical protein [Aerococcus mictus]MCY3083541.1 hypothetical protein [Aerococcus mictus]
MVSKDKAAKVYKSYVESPENNDFANTFAIIIDRTEKSFLSNKKEDYLPINLSDNSNNREFGIYKDFQKLFDDSLNYTETVLPYSQITKFIFDANLTTNQMSQLNETLRGLFKLKTDKLKKFSESQGENSEKITDDFILKVKNTAKFLEHSNLAATQKSNLYEQQKLEIADLDHNSQLLKKRVEEYEEKLKSLNGQLYREIVSILGIFSALMFGLISGFNALIESINALSSTNQNIGRIGMGITIIAAGLILFLYSLIHWISKLSGRKITYDGRERYGIRRIIYRHSLLVFSLLVIMILFFISTLIHIMSISGIIKDILANNFSIKWFSSLFWLITIIIIIILCLIGIIYWFYEKKARDNIEGD